jgi:hypothetical protein
MAVGRLSIFYFHSITLFPYQPEELRALVSTEPILRVVLRAVLHAVTNADAVEHLFSLLRRVFPAGELHLYPLLFDIS